MPATLGQLLDARTRALFGRERERAALLALVHDERPLVIGLHGIAGVGKSTLVQAFAADARAAGAVPVVVDAREVEPTEAGFSAALAAAVGRPGASAEEVATALGGLGERVVLAVDTYELLAGLDAWFARSLVPGLPVNVRVLLAGRERPSGAWLRTYGELLSTARLDNLSPRDAEAMLAAEGVDPEINRLAHGHPLTLRLASSALRGLPSVDVEDAALDAVVEEVARVYLDRLDPATRRALDAASVVRRTTLSLLDAMLPNEPSWEAFERLRALPFVELGGDGLTVHDTVRAVTATLLRAADPVAHRRLRVAAWRRLRDELSTARPDDLWRYTADMLYLVDNPVMRRFFFPATVLDCTVEAATPADWPAIAALAAEEDDIPMDGLVEWWETLPEAFAVVRDADGEIAGFRALAERDDIGPAIARRDALVARWREHLRSDPVPRGGRVLFARYAATRHGRDTPSTAQAALLLDTQRTYIAMRPELRRTYAPAPMLWAAEGHCAMALGYVPLPGEPADLPPRERSLFNDFGPGSIDGWLTDLAASELLVDDEDAPVDPVRRELRLDGERVDLTQLEFDVLRYLHERAGRPVRREDLLRDVWGYSWTGGSNVVEVAISALRKKLGDRAGALKTVRGVGYQLEELR